MPRFKLIIEFDGTQFSGWQIQPDARTVEEELEKAFSQICQTAIDLIGQGRTDAGVHARGQVAHVDLPDTVDVQKLIFGVNGIIGDEIHIREAVQVHDEFHARFDADYRAYSYSLLKSPSPLLAQRSTVLPAGADIKLMHECASLVMGKHDFGGFSKYNVENYTTICTVSRSELEEREGLLIYHIQANRFLRNMVRRIVGTMIWVAEGKITVSDFRQMLNEPDTEIKQFTAPAKALVLEGVFY